MYIHTQIVTHDILQHCITYIHTYEYDIYAYVHVHVFHMHIHIYICTNRSNSAPRKRYDMQQTPRINIQQSAKEWCSSEKMLMPLVPRKRSSRHTAIPIHDITITTKTDSELSLGILDLDLGALANLSPANESPVLVNTS
jgi:hypothetical protein